MGTQNLFMPKSHFDFVDKGFLSEFLYKTMFRFVNSIWVFICNFLFHLFGFIVKYTFRYQVNDCSQKNDLNYCVVHSQQDDQIASNSSTDSVSDGFGEKENCEFSFQFQFPNSEDSNKSIGETENSVFMETASSLSTSKYQFISGKDFSGFMETINFTVQELFVGPNDRNQDAVISADKDFREFNFEQNKQQLQVGSNDASIGNNQSINSGFYAIEDFQELKLEAVTVDQEKAEDSVESLCKEEILEKHEQNCSTDQHEFHENKELSGLENDSSGKLIFSVLPFDSKPETNSSSNGFSISNNKIDSDEFSTDNHVIEEIQSLEKISIGDIEPNLQYSDDLHEENLSGKDLGKVENKHEHGEEMEVIDSVEKSEEPIPSSGRKMWDSDDEDGLGWEHRDLIEQMKLEVRNARTGGLPTILEESETPKMMEDLKPLKIDEKLEHKDRMEEIQKVHKSYAEKMRKLDILNYQTIHAISFLQLKDPVQLTTGQRSVSAIKSLPFPSFWPCKLRRIYADPILKSISELNRELELVYVGQVCLSWEILHWQYGKAKELLEHDSQGLRPYNQVAGEFQQFQVLVQRFVENEQFQGPRVQNYVKNQCIIRALLQVPSIKDDCLKDKKESRVEGKDVISMEMLTEIIEESMRIFWEFLRADKDEANAILKGFQGTHVHLQNPSDSELLMDIKTSLQKKEKRLKDILRSGNCIVKKFQKHQEGRLDHAMFLAQVELRLVSRVLNMSRLTTDQLVWCQKKLNKINFISRKIHVEPTFLLFPS
uniref:Ribosomal protein L34Ae n=1 Tax=Davidia involucrata TaxID=16924 RepID=A0A5B6Z0Q5_DAVIN